MPTNLKTDNIFKHITLKNGFKNKKLQKNH